MTLSAVATRYAKALADVVTQGSTGQGSTGGATSGLGPEAALREIGSFAAALAGSHELGQALSSPAVPGSRKRAVAGRIADVLQLSRIARNFLFVLIDHRRITLLPQIMHSFELIVDERLGFARAEVSAAAQLSDSQRAAIQAQLEHLTGKRIRMRVAVDPSLIGGVMARIGSTVYDGSVRGQLQSLGQRLSTES
jgi:F-type H+-transporting ATPase subunit delta